MTAAELAALPYGALLNRKRDLEADLDDVCRALRARASERDVLRSEAQAGSGAERTSAAMVERMTQSLAHGEVKP